MMKFTNDLILNLVSRYSVQREYCVHCNGRKLSIFSDSQRKAVQSKCVLPGKHKGNRGIAKCKITENETLACSASLWCQHRERCFELSSPRLFHLFFTSVLDFRFNVGSA